MSTPSSHHGRASIPSFAKPIIEAYAAATQPATISLAIMSAFTAMLIPLLVALFYFSTPRTRSRPTFIFASFDICLGIVIGAWGWYIHMRTLLTPLSRVSDDNEYAWTVVFALTPWIVDISLLLRVVAVYPQRTTTRKVLAAILLFPIIIKIARLIMVSINLAHWRILLKELADTHSSGVQSLRSDWTKIEWTLRMVDNGYTTIIFLYKLRGSFVDPDMIGTGSAAGSIMSHVRTLFWIAATTFVFPFILDIIQLGVVFSHATYLTSSYIQMVNTFVAIIGVVFATAWAGEARYRQEHPMVDAISTAFRSNAPVQSVIFAHGVSSGSSTSLPIHFTSKPPGTSSLSSQV